MAWNIKRTAHALLISTVLAASSGCAAHNYEADMFNYVPAPSKYGKFLEGVVVVKTQVGQGSGFFVNDSGFLVTSAHGLKDDVVVEVKLLSGEEIKGVVVDRDIPADLALIKIAKSNTMTIPLGSDPTIGSDVIVIGAPIGFEWSTTKGTVSAIRESKGVRYVQTEAATSPGNSGGPLIDITSGKVIGVNANSCVGGRANGLHFAISAEHIAKVFPYLVLAGGKHE